MRRFLLEQTYFDTHFDTHVIN